MGWLEIVVWKGASHSWSRVARIYITIAMGRSQKWLERVHHATQAVAVERAWDFSHGSFSLHFALSSLVVIFATRRFSVVESFRMRLARIDFLASALLTLTTLGQQIIFRLTLFWPSTQKRKAACIWCQTHGRRKRMKIEKENEIKSWKMVFHSHSSQMALRIQACW